LSDQSSIEVLELARGLEIRAASFVGRLDYGALTKILGKDMVDEKKQRIRDELFALSRRKELVQALLSTAPEILTSPGSDRTQAKQGA
jgi:hypothetical protein